MNITKPQAFQLIRELYSHEPIGADSDGNEISREQNAHFLACARCVFPELPSLSQIRPWVTDESYLSASDFIEREKLADFLFGIARALARPDHRFEVPASIINPEDDQKASG